jgi:hypothetical protein
MAMTNEKVWAWLQAKGKTFKVISDPDKGIIEVRNEHGETLIRKTNLSRRQVEIVEKHFLRLVSKKSTDDNSLNNGQNYDPMIA